MAAAGHARAWDDTATHGAAVVQRVEAGLPWEQDAERARADQDGWLLSFIDVLTLLLTLFVLLLAYQHGRVERDVPEVQVAAPAPQSEPMSAEILDVIEVKAATAAERIDVPTAMPDADSAAPATSVSAARATPADYLALAASWEGDWLAPMLTWVARAVETAPERATLEPEQTPAVADPVERLLAELNEPALRGRVEATRQPGGVDLEISDNILFTPASADLTAGGRTLLDELVAILATLPYELSVEGHTDSRPIATDRFPSNWELSSARASGVTRHLIEQGIPAGRVRAVGYADTRPLADNASPEGRSRNRRVSFILRLPAS
ncbi:MAG: OmpA family protein [Gammaproteobacteria bacterium]